MLHRPPVAVGVAIALGAALLGAPGSARGASPSAPETRFVDYLAIEANEGGASGGHAAIRFGDETYHFQHDAGLLRLTRVDSAEFLFDYSVLENRGIRVSRVPVSPAVYATLRDAFNERYLVQSRELDRLVALHADGELIASLIDRARAAERAAAAPASDSDRRAVTIDVPAAGFFFADSTDAERSTVETPAVAAPALVRLGARAAREIAPDFVATRRADLIEDLRRLAPPVRAPDDPAWSSGATYSERYLDRLSALLALAVLERALALRPEAHRAPADADFALRDADRAALARFADQLESDLLHGLQSDRPGAGFALLVGMARLVALRQSVDSGRLVVLDAYPAAARRRTALSARERAILPELVGDAAEDFARARRDLDRREVREAEWARVETAANRLLELRGALAGAPTIRLAPGPFVPDRPARSTELVSPDARPEELEQALAAVQAAEAGLRGRLAERYRYHLIARNCVTEIFALVDQSLATAGERDALGGAIAPDEPLQFIPFLSDRTVGERWRVGERAAIPSYRERRLRELAERDGELATALRESTTLTSTLYERRAPKDSAFLFFTDRAPLLRPALGAANLAVGLGVAAAGLPIAPFDGGAALSSGLRGALFSLPELAFVDIRKGSFDWVARRESGLAGPAAP